MSAEQVCFTPAGITVISVLLAGMAAAVAKQYHDASARAEAENAYLRRLLSSSLNLNEEQIKEARALRRRP